MTPTLWHIPVSHYSEKVRWALAWKEVEHRRRAPRPPAHMAVALWLTRGERTTFPVLELDGRRVGDSTAIIAALEQRWPQPPLYPADPAERARALELEEFFDEQLGPHARLLAWHELIRDRDTLAELVARDLPASLRASPRIRAGATSFVTAFVSARYGVRSAERAELAREKVLKALDRLEAELGSDDYLVGDGFTVADLTAAALLYPVVLPPGSPVTQASSGMQGLRDSLAERPGYRWVEEVYRRHRAGPAAAQRPAAGARPTVA